MNYFLSFSNKQFFFFSTLTVSAHNLGNLSYTINVDAITHISLLTSSTYSHGSNDVLHHIHSNLFWYTSCFEKMHNPLQFVFLVLLSFPFLFFFNSLFFFFLFPSFVFLGHMETRISLNDLRIQGFYNIKIGVKIWWFIGESIWNSFSFFFFLKLIFVWFFKL